jgi:hypothetical protein
VRRVWRGSATKGIGVLIEEEPTEVGELLLRPEQLQAFVGTLNAGLTPHQFTLQWVLAEHRGEVLPRARLYELVWGHAIPPKDSGVDSAVSDVRTKLARISPGWTTSTRIRGLDIGSSPEPVQKGACMTPAPREVRSRPDARLSGRPCSTTRWRSARRC